MRVAIVHDYLVHVRGGERVLAEICKAYPEATIFSLVIDRAQMSKWVDSALGGRRVQGSIMARLPLTERNFRRYAALLPAAAQLLSLSRYDLVLSSSSAFAHCVRVPRHIPHISYCYTPLRYAWSEAATSVRAVPPIGRPAAVAMLGAFRAWDRSRARRVTAFATSSQFMRQRIGRYYGRDARVLPPPVDLDRFAPVPGAKEYFLCLSALMPYKRVDLAVEACTRLRVPLRVVGSGTEDQRLRAMAGPTVKFVNSASDAEVQGLYAHCRALLFPAADDFGITSLEAQAAGRPVVAFREGGALETVLDGQTGVFFDQQSADCLAATLSSTDFDSFDPHTIRRNAESYAPAAFRARFRNYVQEVVARFNREGDE